MFRWMCLTPWNHKTVTPLDQTHTTQLTSVCPGLWWQWTAGVRLLQWPAWHTVPCGCLTPPQSWTGQHCRCSRTASLAGGNTPLWSCLIRPGGQGTGTGGATSAPLTQVVWVLELNRATKQEWHLNNCKLTVRRLYMLTSHSDFLDHTCSSCLLYLSNTHSGY